MQLLYFIFRLMRQNLASFSVSSMDVMGQRLDRLVLFHCAVLVCQIVGRFSLYFSTYVMRGNLCRLSVSYIDLTDTDWAFSCFIAMFQRVKLWACFLF